MDNGTEQYGTIWAADLLGSEHLCVLTILRLRNLNQCSFLDKDSEKLFLGTFALQLLYDFLLLLFLRNIYRRSSFQKDHIGFNYQNASLFLWKAESQIETACQ